MLKAISRSGWVPRAVWQRLPAGGTLEIDLPKPARSFKFKAHPDDHVARELLWRGRAAPEWQSIAVVSKLSLGASCVVDVGAHVGLYSLSALATDSDCRVVAFEPVASNRASMTLNLDLNGWGHRCELRPEALADRTGRALLHLPLDERPDAPPKSGALSPSEHVGSTLEVDVGKGDELISERRRVGLIKIDVEGAEASVLRGLSRTITTQRPALVIERLSGHADAEVEELLRGWGYRFFQIGPAGLTPSDALTADPSRLFLNHLCLSPDDSRLPELPVVGRTAATRG